eukprot:gene3646-4541_t
MRERWSNWFYMENIDETILDKENDKNIIVLSMEELLNLLESHIRKTAEILRLSMAHTSVLLSYYKWDHEKLLQTFIENGDEYVFQKAGLPSTPQPFPRPIRRLVSQMVKDTIREDSFILPLKLNSSSNTIENTNNQSISSSSSSLKTLTSLSSSSSSPSPSDPTESDLETSSSSTTSVLSNNNKSNYGEDKSINSLFPQSPPTSSHKPFSFSSNYSYLSNIEEIDKSTSTFTFNNESTMYTNTSNSSTSSSSSSSDCNDVSSTTDDNDQDDDDEDENINYNIKRPISISSKNNICHNNNNNSKSLDNSLKDLIQLLNDLQNSITNNINCIDQYNNNKNLDNQTIISSNEDENENNNNNQQQLHDQEDQDQDNYSSSEYIKDGADDIDGLDGAGIIQDDVDDNSDIDSNNIGGDQTTTIIPTIDDNINMDPVIDETTILSSSSTPNNFFISCNVCMSDVPKSLTYKLSCDHTYCLDCWKSYLSSKIDEGTSCLFAKCISPQCKITLDISNFRKILDDKLYNKFIWLFFKSFVDHCPKASWCTNPESCGMVIYYNGVDLPLVMNVSCTCKWRFCFHCGDEYHLPSTCKQLNDWKTMLLEKDGEDALWVTQNTKKCPMCKIHIEKNEGCMHMFCTNCRFEFCWLCKGPWAEHGDRTGGFFSCNRYDPLKHDTPDLDRKFGTFVHNLQRFNYHTNAKRVAVQKLSVLETLKSVLHHDGGEVDENGDPRAPWDKEYLIDGINLVVECRHTLKYTYVYGFYITRDEREKELFEFLQEDLEKSAEHLCEILFKEVEYLENQTSSASSSNSSTISSSSGSHQVDIAHIKNYHKVTKKFLENLLSGIQNGLTSNYGQPSDQIKRTKKNKRTLQSLLKRKLTFSKS